MIIEEIMTMKIPFSGELLIIMEELANNLFVRRSFPPQFDSQIWQIISAQPAPQFQASQLILYNVLRKEPALQEEYFQKFEKNHLRVYEWYLLAVRDKIELQPYLFRPLLQKTPSFRQSKQRKQVRSCYPHRHSRTEPNEIRKLLVTQSLHKEKTSTFCQDDFNSHELYMETFAACGGERYVPYDYGRHMKSRMERAHYNKYIRQSHKRHNTTPTHQSQHALSKFMEWTQTREKISLIPFRGILTNEGLNSERGLQNMLKRKGNQKLVFINHQRKPINYYLRSECAKQNK